MKDTIEFIFRSIFIGMGTTIVMDIWAAVLRRFGITSLSFAFPGLLVDSEDDNRGKGAYSMLMNHNRVWGGFWLLMIGLGCSRNEPNPTTNTQALGSAVQPPSAPNASPAAPTVGLDACLVGSWKSARVTLTLSTVRASGGAGVAMKIEPTGASVIDFTPMAPIDATTNNSMKFDFRYSGKATGNLKTPSPGVVGVSQSDYSGLNVSATVKIPGGASVALFKDTPVASLAAMAGSLAAGAKAQTAPTAPTQGIDASPVFSTDTYTCAGSALTLSSAVAHSQWTFTRVPG